jgi:hypothetical protein
VYALKARRSSTQRKIAVRGGGLLNEVSGYRELPIFNVLAGNYLSARGAAKKKVDSLWFHS